MIRYGIEDIEAVERVFKNPEIYERISDDGSPDLVDFDIKPLLEHESFYFLSPHPNMVFQYTPLNSIMYEIHVNVLKESRDMALELGLKTISYMFNETNCEKLVANIPDLFKDVIGFSFKGGFTREGLLSKAYKKNDILYDIHVMGLKKEGTWVQQPQ